MNTGLAQVVRMGDLGQTGEQFSKVELREDVLEQIKKAQGMIDLSLDVHDLTYVSQSKTIGPDAKSTVGSPGNHSRQQNLVYCFQIGGRMFQTLFRVYCIWSRS